MFSIRGRNITFKIFENDEKVILCYPNRPLSYYKDRLGDDEKFKKYIFATEENAYIDDKTLCEDIIGDCVCFRPNGLFVIYVKIFNDGEDDPIKELIIRIPLSSTVKDLKKKLILKLYLNYDEIKVKYGEKELNEDDYIFSYKKKEDFEMNVIITKHVKDYEIFFFKFPDDKLYVVNLDPDTTFKQINKMGEFKKQDYSFFIKDTQINNNSKISEYDEAKNKSTPIQLKINYYSKVTYVGSNSDPKEYLHPFASDQKVSDVLDEFARVVKERRKLSYNEKEMDEETQLSEIKYKKGTAFDITILPAEYSFIIEGTKEEFKLRLNGDITIKKLIRKIQEDKDIKYDLEIYTGSKIDPHKHEENETVSEIKESERIIIKKVDPLYKIYFKDDISEKRLDVKWTVSDLLKSNKKYKSPNERQKMVVKHKYKILPDDSLLCDLHPRKISIELLDPIYQFKFKDHAISVSIPDDAEYNEAIDIVKEYIEDIKEKETERIEFQLEDFIFDYDTKFGPDIPQENPIVINVLNPEYIWTVKETEDDDGKEMEFDFPEEFTISDAVKAIEKKFNYKCSVKIIKKTGKGKSARFIPLKNDTNLYSELYNNINIQVYVQKCPPKFKFATDSKEFEKEFHNDDKVYLITKYLRIKNNQLSFSDSSDDDAEIKNRVEFEYKGKKIENTATFDSLNYQPYEEDKIEIKLLPNTETNKQDNNCFIDDNDEKMHIIVDRIGEGATSITYKVFDIANERTMCKKILKYGKNKTIKDLQNSIKEFQFLITVNHPCICGAYGINIQEPIKTDLNQEVTTVALFLEFLEYDLSDCLTKKLLNNSMKARIVVEICHGMFHVHKLNCIHRDLKIDNIMLDSKFKAKLVDFGYSYINESLFGSESFSKTSMSKGVGTIDFMSPEMVNEEEYDNKTDVYSFGIVLYYIFVGSKPDYKMKDKMLGKPIKLPKPSKSISQFCLDLIQKCTMANPNDRPSFEAILNELRKNSYNLADGVDESFVAKRDNELLSFK